MSKKAPLTSLCLLLLLAVVCSETRAQSAVSFVKHVPADRDNLIFLADPLPQLEKLLSSPALRKVLVEGKLSTLAQEGVSLDPAGALPVIRDSDKYIPTEIVLAIPSSSYKDLTTLAYFGLLSGLCAGAVEAGDDEAGKSLPVIYDDALKQMRKFTLPRLTIYAQFRAPDVANQAMTILPLIVGQFAARPGIDVTVEEDQIGITTQVGKLMSVDELQKTLFEMGVTNKEKDPKTALICEELSRIELEIWLQRFGSALQLTVGPKAMDENAGYDVAKLGTLWKPDDKMSMFARWNVERLKSGLDAVNETWQQWKDTPTGKETRKLDDDDLVGDLQLIIKQLEPMANRGTMRVDIDRKIEAVSHATGAKPSQPIAESGIGMWLPNDAEIMVVSATQSAAEYFSKYVSKFEDRLAWNSMKYELMNKARQAAMTEAMSKFYYGKLSKFRSLIHTDSHEVFAPPVAMLVGSKGKIERLTVQFDSDGEANRITLTDAPTMEYLLIGRLRDPSKRPEFFNQIWKSFLSAYLEDVPEESTQTIDLGLGVKTLGFNSNFWSKVPGNTAVSIKGDLVPHFFISDGWVIFSTSARLSKKVLAAKSGKQRFAFVANDQKSLVTYGRMPANTLGNFMDMFGEIFSDFLQKQGRFQFEGRAFEGGPSRDEAEKIGSIFVGMGEIVRLADMIQWRSEDHKNMRVSRFEMTFSKD